MDKHKVWIGGLIICFVAVAVMTIFPSKHKQCIDRNRVVIEELKGENAPRELIKDTGFQIGIKCKADNSFNFTK